MENTDFIIILIVIAIICSFIIYINDNYIRFLTLSVILLAGLYLYKSNHENLVDRDKIINNSINDFGFSKYGNVSLSEDIDMAQQMDSDAFNATAFKNSGFNKSSTIDNNDVIEEAITRGVSLFNPSENSFTPINGNAVDLVQASKFDIPLSGKQNVDELLARKQQQRANLNKMAIDGAVQSTKNIYEKYFSEELDENEHRVWWSSEAQDLETDWNPY